MLQPPSSPIIVGIIEESEFDGLADVVIGAIGLAGALALVAVIFGILLAGLFVLYQTLRHRWGSASTDSGTQELGLSRLGPGERLL